MSDTGADDSDNEAYATMNEYFDSRETAREFAKRIQGKPTLDADGLDEGRKTFTSLHETSKAHADYTAESHAQVSDYEDDDHPGKSIYQDLIKMSAHSQAAASASANGAVPDLAFVLEEESQAAPAGEALGEVSSPSVNAEARGDGPGTGPT